jgi:hypothetical protein
MVGYPPFFLANGEEEVSADSAIHEYRLVQSNPLRVIRAHAFLGPDRHPPICVLFSMCR